VFAPHGQRLTSLGQRRLLVEAQKGLRDSGIKPLDLVMPGPEDEGVRYRLDYEKMIPYLNRAQAVVFVGYGFGGGDDAVSLEDFGRHTAKHAKVHVLSPN